MIAVLDVGTTKIKIVVFDESLKIEFLDSVDVEKSVPKEYRAEQNPIEIYKKSLSLINKVKEKYPSITKLGITNQRESFVLWNKVTGKPYYPAILWQDKRSRLFCEKLKSNKEISALVRNQTGLIINEYFTASKLRWLLKHLDLEATDLNNIAFGTIDSWIIYKLTGNHCTDVTNASRTMLFDIRNLHWQEELLKIFGVPKQILPKVLPSKSDFGTIKDTDMQIVGVIGDQQASMYAAGNEIGTVKATYGTGVFVMKLLGEEFKLEKGFLTTLAVYKGENPEYLLEAKIEDGSARTTPVLNNEEKLKQVVEEIATETAPTLSRLIDDNTKVVFVDGGISQNNNLVRKQQELNNIKIERLSTYEGSALGVAKLISQ